MGLLLKDWFFSCLFQLLAIGLMFIMVVVVKCVVSL